MDRNEPRLGVPARRTALRSGLESLALRLLGLAGTFLLGVVVARALGPVQYGVYGLITSVAALLASICPIGTPQLAVREFGIRAARRRHVGGYRRLLTFQGATLLAWAMLCAAALIALALLPGPGAGDLTDWSIGAALALWLAQGALVSAALRGAGAMNQGQVMETLGRPLGALALALGVLASAQALTVRTALAVQLAVALVGAGLCQVWFHRLWTDRRRIAAHHNEPVPTVVSGRWLGQALPLGFVDAVRQFDATYGLIMMGWLAGDLDLGLFRVALACGTAANMAISIVHVVLAPRVSQLFDAGRTDQLQPLLHRVSLAMIGISAGVVVLLALFGRAAITVAFGPAFTGAWPSLVVLAVGQLCFGVFGMGPIMLAMSGSGRPLMAIYAVSAICGVACAVPLIAQFGSVGAAMAQAVSLTIVGGLSDLYARRRLGVATSILAGGRWRRARAPATAR